MLARSEKATADHLDPASGNQAHCHFLVVEDDPTVRLGLVLLIEGWGHQVTAAASGEQALELWAAHRAETSGDFDAIIADHRLGPGLTGSQTASRIRDLAGHVIPTLVVTGDTAPERIAEVHASGFEILHKPVGAAELRRCLARLLAG